MPTFTRTVRREARTAGAFSSAGGDTALTRGQGHATATFPPILRAPGIISGPKIAPT